MTLKTKLCLEGLDSSEFVNVRDLLLSSVLMKLELLQD